LRHQRRVVAPTSVSRLCVAVRPLCACILTILKSLILFLAPLFSFFIFSVVVVRSNMYTEDETRTPRLQQYAFLEFKYGFNELDVQWRNSSQFYYSNVFFAYSMARLQSSYVVSFDQQQCSSNKLFNQEFSRADTWKCDVSPTQFCLPNESWTLWTVSKGAIVFST
jgi:hypothetical protein